jgi:hypothetical protein
MQCGSMRELNSCAVMHGLDRCCRSTPRGAIHERRRPCRTRG